MTMKKNILTIMIAMLLVCATCFTSAAVSAQYTYEFENITVIFDEDITLDEQQKAAIAEHLVHGDEDVTTYGLWCTLFGHSYETHMAKKITHCVYDTNPRCLEEIYEVQVCTRCENTVSTVVARSYISCCAEE